MDHVRLGYAAHPAAEPNLTSPIVLCLNAWFSFRVVSCDFVDRPLTPAKKERSTKSHETTRSLLRPRTDPVTFVFVSVLFLLIAAGIASWLPAQRAAGLDPTTRDE
jgi:hypothetical protein